MKKTTTCVLGMDLGDKWSVVGGIVLATGEVLPHRRVRMTPEHVEEFFSSVAAPARIAIETGTHSPWVFRIGERCGHEMIVAQARKLRAIWQNDRKSDDADVDILWQIAHVRPDLLKPIRHRSESSQEDLSLLRLREQAVDTRTGLINAVRGTLKSLGHQAPRCSPQCFHNQAADELPEHLEPVVLPMLLAIEYLTTTIATYDGLVAHLVKTKYRRQTKRLIEIPGVGNLTALAFVLVIDDPSRFRKSRQVGAYLGLVPRRDQSGGADLQLPISKAGDRMLRRLLVQCAHYVLGRHGEDSDLRRWGEARMERGGTAGKKKAIVAIARRLAVLMHRVWVSDEPYSRFHVRDKQLATAA